MASFFQQASSRKAPEAIIRDRVPLFVRGVTPARSWRTVRDDSFLSSREPRT